MPFPIANSTHSENMPKPWLPLTRDQYKTCHVYIPDLGERLPAIRLGQHFYSFLKTVRDKQKALDIVARLFEAGDQALITSSRKAYAIWVLEPDAAMNG